MTDSERQPRYDLFFSQEPWRAFTQCPRCQSKTRQRQQMLVIYIEPDILFKHKMACRLCVECDLLIVRDEDLYLSLGESRYEQLENSDLGILGTLDKSDWRTVSSAQEIQARLHPFRDRIQLMPTLPEMRAKGAPDFICVSQADLTPLAQTPPAAQVLELPAVESAWELVLSRLHTWMTTDDDELLRPYNLLIVEQDSDLVVYQELFDQLPAPQVVGDCLYKAMAKPNPPIRQPRRPTAVYVDDETLVFDLSERLSQVGVVCILHPTPQAHNALDSLNAHLGDSLYTTPGLLDAPNVTPEQIASLFAAAADFYRAAPWRHISDDQVIAVRIQAEGKPWRYVSVMGQGGVSFGLAVFYNWQELQRLFSDGPVGLVGNDKYRSISFGTMAEIPFADLDALEEHGWEIAGPQAYPLPIIFMPQGEVLRPNSAELAWYEAALRAVPVFIKKHLKPGRTRPPRPAQTALTAFTADGDMTVELAYPATNRDLEGLPNVNKVYRFKVALKRQKNLWRRIEILGQQTLGDLDAEIRDVFNHDMMDHLSEFSLHTGQRGRYEGLGEINPFGKGSGAEVSVASLGLEPKGRMEYVYDFGDWIEHTLILEAIDDPESDVEYPRVVAKNRPRYHYCERCRIQGRKTVATWICIECSDVQERDMLFCDECMDIEHMDHYADELVY